MHLKCCSPNTYIKHHAGNMRTPVNKTENFMHTHAGACALAAEVEHSSQPILLIGILGDGARDVCHVAVAVVHPEVPPRIVAGRGGVDPCICLH